MYKDNYINATIEGIDKGDVFLKTEKGDILTCAENNITGDKEVGQDIKIFFVTEEDENEGRSDMAKAVLNEILKTD